MTDNFKTEQQNVVAFSSAKKGRSKPTAGGDDQIASVRDRQMALSDVINDDPLRGAVMPDFPERFLVSEEELGARLPLFMDKLGVVRVVKLTALTNAIVSYTSNLPKTCQGYHWTVRQCAEAAEYWLASTKPVKPKMMVWRDDDGPAYTRLPWPYDEEMAKEPTPLFDELFSRISNAEALKHWIASLFFEKSYLQQYVWVYGVGGSGKSTLANFVSDVFGPAATSLNPPPRGRDPDKFWTAKLLKKRFAVFPDCDNVEFITGGFFKGITGGGKIPVEKKRKDSFDVVLFSKYMILSNEEPQLPGDEEDTRRALICNVGSLKSGTEFDPKYGEKLWKEGGAFLMKIIMDYRDAYPDHGPIKGDRATMERITSTTEERFEAVAETRFNFAKGLQCAPVDFQKIMGVSFSSEKDRAAFRKYIRRVHGVEKKQRREGDKRHWYYDGCTVKGGVASDWIGQF